MMSLFFKFRLIFETVIYLAAAMVKATVIYSGFKALDYFYKLGLRYVSILYYMGRRVPSGGRKPTHPLLYKKSKIWLFNVLGFVCYENVRCF